MLHRAVVHYGAEFARHLLADAAGERGDAFAIEVGFEAMAHRFMKQNAGPARAKHHGHFASRCLHRFQLHDGLAGGFTGERFGTLRAGELIQPYSPAAAGKTALWDAAVLACQDADVHARHGLTIRDDGAIAGGNQHLPQAVGPRSLHLEDSRIIRASDRVSPLHHRGAVGQRGFGWRSQDGVKIVRRAAFIERCLVHLGRTRRDHRRHSTGLADAFGREIIAVGVAGFLSRNDSHAHAKGDALHGALYDGFVHANAAGGEIFEVEVGIIATRRQGFGQPALEISGGNGKLSPEERICEGHALRVTQRGYHAPQSLAAGSATSRGRMFQLRADNDGYRGGHA